MTQSLYSITLYSEEVARLLASGAGSKAVEHLRGMRERVQGIGSTLRIESSPGKAGTTIHVAVPADQVAR